MKSIPFGKLCKVYNLKYKELFGYVPCKDDYKCSQEEYLAALIESIEKKIELHAILSKRVVDYSDENKVI